MVQATRSDFSHLYSLLGRAAPAVAHQLANHVNSALGYAELATTTSDSMKAGEYIQRSGVYADKVRQLAAALRALDPEMVTVQYPGYKDLIDALSCVACSVAKVARVSVSFEATDLSHCAKPLAQVHHYLFQALDALMRSDMLRGRPLNIKFTPSESMPVRWSFGFPDAMLAEQFESAIARLNELDVSVEIDDGPTAVEARVHLPLQ